MHLRKVSDFAERITQCVGKMQTFRVLEVVMQTVKREAFRNEFVKH